MFIDSEGIKPVTDKLFKYNQFLPQQGSINYNDGLDMSIISTHLCPICQKTGRCLQNTNEKPKTNWTNQYTL